MKRGMRILAVLTLLTIVFSLSACGKKTPLYFRDRADSSHAADYNGNK